MAFTKVVGAGIHTLSNITSHNINSSGIITATKFVGPFDGTSGTFSGNVTIGGNLSVAQTVTYEDVKNVDSVGVGTFREGIKIPFDNKFLLLGESNDLSLAHTAGHSYIADTGAGGLYLTGSNVRIQNATQTEDIAVFNQNDSVDLYFNDDLKFQTTSSGVSIGGTTIITSASGGKLGIGTDDPQKLLELQHSTNRKLQFSYDDNIITIKGSNNSANPETIRLIGGNSIRFNTGATGSGTEKVRITSDGTVGIGTNNPGNFNAAADNLVVGTGVGHNGITVNSAADGDGWLVFNDAPNNNLTGSIQYNHVDNYMEFRTNTSPRLRIDTSGRVIIGGGATPTQVGDGRLIVYADTRLHPGIKVDCLQGGSNTANGFTLIADNYQADESIVNLGVSYSGSAAVLSRGVKVSNTADNAYISSYDTGSNKPTALRLDGAGKLTFLNTSTSATTTTDSAVTLSPRLQIDSSGNFSIGGNFTAGRHVHIKDNGQIKLENTSTGGWAGLEWLVSSGTDNFDAYMGLQDADGLFFIDNNSNGIDFAITQGGNVGINAANPNSLFEVRGTAGTYTNGVTVFTGNTTHSGSNAKNGVGLYSFGDALKGGLSSNLLYSNSSTPSQSYATRSSGQIEITNTTSSNATSEITFGGYYKGTTTFVERLRILSNGNIRQVKTGANVNLTLSRNESVGTTNQALGVIDFASNTAHTVQARVMAKSLGTSNVGGDLVIETRADGGSLDERIRFTGAGDVAIGRDSAQANYADGSTTDTTRLAVVKQSAGSGYHEMANFTAGSDSNDTGSIVRIGHFSNDRGLYIKAGRGTSDQAKGIIGLRTSSAADQDIIRILQGGQVIIGTNTVPSNSNTPLRIHTSINSSSANSLEITHSTNGAHKLGAAIGIAVQNGGESTNTADLKFATANNGSTSTKMTLSAGGILRHHISKNTTAIEITTHGDGAHSFGDEARMDFLMRNEVPQSTGNPAARIASYLQRGNNGYGLRFYARTNASTLFKAMEMTADYEVLPGVDGVQDLGSTSYRWKDIYTSDLDLSNETKGGNSIDGTWGSYKIEEGENDLFIINRRNGKKYKFNLTEVS